VVVGFVLGPWSAVVVAWAHLGLTSAWVMVVLAVLACAAVVVTACDFWWAARIDSGNPMVVAVHVHNHNHVHALVAVVVPVLWVVFFVLRAAVDMAHAHNHRTDHNHNTDNHPVVVCLRVSGVLAVVPSWGARQQSRQLGQFLLFHYQFYPSDRS
jgi:hypothetical protein